MKAGWAPSAKAWWLAVAGLGLAAGGAVSPGLERWLLPYNVGLIALVATTGVVGSRSRRLSAHRAHRESLAARAGNPVTLTIENQGKRPLQVEVFDEELDGSTTSGHEQSLRIPAGESRRMEYLVVPTRRGAQEFRGTYVRFLAPLGLARIVQHLDNPSDVRVMPNVRPLRDFELLRRKGHLASLGVRKALGKGTGMEFVSLRDYNDDDVRLMHWGATARRGRLVVKEFEPERNQAVVACLDLGRHMLGEVGGIRKIEHMLDAAVFLLHAASRQGDLTGVLAFDEDVRAFVAPHKGHGHATLVADSIFDLEPLATQPHYRAAVAHLGHHWRRRGLVVLFTDAGDADQARELASAFAPLRRRHLVVIVRVTDPDAGPKMGAVTSTGALLESAAELWDQDERDAAGVILRNAGLECIEASPSELAGALVSAYLRFKDRARI
ncbi:MAG: DUF58 domain-containing protein [Fimbriimonadaceae bacterium]